MTALEGARAADACSLLSSCVDDPGDAMSAVGTVSTDPLDPRGWGWCERAIGVADEELIATPHVQEYLPINSSQSQGLATF
jgi:hypothetical protein